MPHGTRATALVGAPLASFSRRAVALAIDFFASGLLFLAVTVWGGQLAIWLGLFAPAGDVSIRFGFFDSWDSVVWLVAYFALGTYFGHGQTPGKRLCRIRVVSLAHERLGFWHALERALGYGASTLEGGFGFFQYFLRDDRRTVHDRIAETIVIATPRRHGR
jgi:uncharacterized RDD family membrane protein YckC